MVDGKIDIPVTKHWTEERTQRDIVSCNYGKTPDKWDTRFLNQAKEVSTWSKDPSTQVGAVIAKGNRQLGQGFNGFPPRIDDKEEWLNDRSIKLPLVIHAEKNAIYDALSRGPAIGCTLYLYPLSPCGECAKDVVAAPLGIERVVVLSYNPKKRGYWKQAENESRFVFEKAGIKFEVIYENQE